MLHWVIDGLNYAYIQKYLGINLEEMLHKSKS